MDSEIIERNRQGFIVIPGINSRFQGRFVGMKSVAMSEPVGRVKSHHSHPPILEKTFQLNNKLDNLPMLKTEAHSKGVFFTQQLPEFYSPHALILTVIIIVRQCR